MKRWTREAVIARAQEVAAKHGGRLTCDLLKDEGGVAYVTVTRRFKGGYAELRRAAGLEEPANPRKVSDETLLEEFHRVAKTMGRVPNVRQVCRVTGRAPRTMRRLGRRGTVKERYRLWLASRGQEAWWARAPEKAMRAGGHLAVWRRCRGYGEPLDLRGIRHAPVNEMGVVALFGALAEDLGFLVEAVRVRFPDCEAKRLVDARAGRWEGVLIEFEYWSSGFKMHGHDAKGCDLIVCWEHDWKECPVEVLELKREVMRLKERRRCA